MKLANVNMRMLVLGGVLFFTTPARGESSYCKAGKFGQQCGNVDDATGQARGTVDQCYEWAKANCPTVAPAFSTGFTYKPSEGGFCYCMDVQNVQKDGTCSPGNWQGNNDYSTFVMYGDDVGVSKSDTVCATTTAPSYALIAAA